MNGNLRHAENDHQAHPLTMGHARVGLATNKLRLYELVGQLYDTVLATVNRQLAR